MYIFQTLRGTGGDYVHFAKCAEKMYVHLFNFLRGRRQAMSIHFAKQRSRFGVNPFGKMLRGTEEAYIKILKEAEEGGVSIFLKPAEGQVSACPFCKTPRDWRVDVWLIMQSYQRGRRGCMCNLQNSSFKCHRRQKRGISILQNNLEDFCLPTTKWVGKTWGFSSTFYSQNHNINLLQSSQ